VCQGRRLYLFSAFRHVPAHGRCASVRHAVRGIRALAGRRSASRPRRQGAFKQRGQLPVCPRPVVPISALGAASGLAGLRVSSWPSGPGVTGWLIAAQAGGSAGAIGQSDRSHWSGPRCEAVPHPCHVRKGGDPRGPLHRQTGSDQHRSILAPVRARLPIAPLAELHRRYIHSATLAMDRIRLHLCGS